MTKLPFFLVDVFSEEPLAGNPLALVSGGEGLDATTMARIAREFNQSETTFVLPATKEGADWRLRSFTAAGIEVYGAGHNALGAWWWLADSGQLPPGEYVQEIGKRLLPVQITRDEAGRVGVAMTQAAPVFGAVCGDLTTLAAALGLSTHELGTGDLPCQVVSTGAAHLLVPVKNREAVCRAHPDLAKLGGLLRGMNAQGCYLFSTDPLLPGSAAHTRFFNPVEGIPEDAATGSAAGPLACYLVVHGIEANAATLAFEQGYCMHRPSLIRARVNGDAVQVLGGAVLSAEGTLYL